MKSTYDYLVDKVTNSLLKENAAGADEAEIYRFGIEIIIMKSLHFLSYFVTVAYIRKVPEFIIIFGIFYAFRRNVGGFHAKTMWYWKYQTDKNGLNGTELVEAGATVRDITHFVNGEENGLNERQTAYDNFKWEE